MNWHKNISTPLKAEKNSMHSQIFSPETQPTSGKKMAPELITFSRINVPIRQNYCVKSLEDKYSKYLSKPETKPFIQPRPEQIESKLNQNSTFDIRPKSSNKIKSTNSHQSEQDSVAARTTIPKNCDKLCPECIHKDLHTTRLNKIEKESGIIFDKEKIKIANKQKLIDEKNQSALNSKSFVINNKIEIMSKLSPKEYEEPVNTILSTNFGIDNGAIKNKEKNKELEKVRAIISDDFKDTRKYPEW